MDSGVVEASSAPARESERSAGGQLREAGAQNSAGGGVGEGAEEAPSAPSDDGKGSAGGDVKGSSAKDSADGGVDPEATECELRGDVTVAPACSDATVAEGGPSAKGDSPTEVAEVSTQTNE